MKLTIVSRNNDLYPRDKYHANTDRGGRPGTESCPICGKDAKYLTGTGNQLKQALHMFGGGSLLTDLDDFDAAGLPDSGDFDRSGDMLFFPCGRDCWKVWEQLKASGKFDVDTDLQDGPFKAGQRVCVRDDAEPERSYVICSIEGDMATLDALLPRGGSMQTVVPVGSLYSEIRMA